MTQQTFIEGIQKRHIAVRQKITDLAGMLSEEQLNFKPHAKSWSIAEVIEHLTTANTTYFPGIQKLLSTENKGAPAELYKTNLAARFLLSMIKPKGPKMPSPGIFMPAKSELGKDTLQRYLANCQTISEFILKSRDTNLVKLKMPSPAARIARFNLGGVFDIFVTHAERHYEQMLRVKNSEGFPK